MTELPSRRLKQAIVKPAHDCLPCGERLSRLKAWTKHATTCLLLLAAIMEGSGCAGSQPESVSLARPATEPVSNPSLSMISGTYGQGGDVRCVLVLNADGKYQREEGYVLDLPAPDGTFSGWTNREQGTWTLNGSRVSLVPRDHDVQNAFAQKKDFDSHTVFSVRWYKNQLALTSETDPYYLLTKDSFDPLYLPVNRAKTPDPHNSRPVRPTGDRN